MAPFAESVGWVFGWLLRNSAHAAVLAGVVWILERTLLHRLAPRWRYGLWLMVFARLLLPIAPASSLSLFNLVDFVPGQAGVLVGQFLGLPAPLPVSLTEMPHPLVDTPAWFLVALALWLPGALVLGAIVLRDHRRLQSALARTVPVTDSYILDLLQQSKSIMKVRAPVLLVEGDQVSSPAISGWRRPRLLVPTGLLERMTTDEIRFLFLHELAHVKRGDLALNWFLAALQILHWFNPGVWIALRRLISVREEVCDENVLRSCFAGAAREYGMTLLHLLEECAPRRIVPALAGILDDVRSLRQRMRCIRMFGTPETHPWVPVAVTLVIAITGLTENRSYHALGTSRALGVSEDWRLPGRSHARHDTPAALAKKPLPQPAARTTSGSSPEPDDDSPSPLQAFATLFRQVIADAAAKLGPPAPSETKPPTAPLPRPADATAVTRPVMASPARTPRAIPMNPARRVMGKPIPLPPVGQRGDILRPRRSDISDLGGTTGHGFVAPQAPYSIRPTTFTPANASRQNG